MNRDIEAQRGRTLREKVRHEIETFAIIFAYLYVCFGAILFYRDAVLQADGVSLADYGAAVIKAAILGKFMLVGQNWGLGEGWVPTTHVPALEILRKASLFLVLLVVLTVVEEAVVALIHGRGVVQAIREVAGGNWQQRIASCLLLWLILMPYFIIRKIAELLGRGGLRRMLFSRQ